MIIEFNPIDYSTKGDHLMAWARQQAPVTPGMEWANDVDKRRRVRLEISALPDQPYHAPECGCEKHGIVARAYLAEPRCAEFHKVKDSGSYCECGPLAERRLA